MPTPLAPLTPLAPVTPLLRTCQHPGCATLTMGELCLRHEQPVTRTFPRGRPYVPSEAARAPVVGMGRVPAARGRSSVPAGLTATVGAARGRGAPRTIDGVTAPAG